MRRWSCETVKVLGLFGWLLKRDCRPAASVVTVKLWRSNVSILVKCCHLLMVTENCSREHERFFSFRLFDISAKIHKYKTFLCRFYEDTGRARDMSQTGLYPYISICLKLWRWCIWRSEECLNSHYFVLECREKWKQCVWCHRCNSHQHSTAENSQTAIFCSVWLTEVFLCGQQRQHWIKWFGFESKGNVELLHPKINTMKKI